MDLFFQLKRSSKELVLSEKKSRTTLELRRSAHCSPHFKGIQKWYRLDFTYKWIIFPYNPTKISKFKQFSLLWIVISTVFRIMFSKKYHFSGETYKKFWNYLFLFLEQALTKFWCFEIRYPFFYLKKPKIITKKMEQEFNKNTQLIIVV